MEQDAARVFFRLFLRLRQGVFFRLSLRLRQGVFIRLFLRLRQGVFFRLSLRLRQGVGIFFKNCFFNSFFLHLVCGL